MREGLNRPLLCMCVRVSQVVSERLIVRYGHLFCVRFGERLADLERGQHPMVTSLDQHLVMTTKNDAVVKTNTFRGSPVYSCN